MTTADLWMAAVSHLERPKLHPRAQNAMHMVIKCLITADHYDCSVPDARRWSLVAADNGRLGEIDRERVGGLAVRYTPAVAR